MCIDIYASLDTHHLRNLEDGPTWTHICHRVMRGKPCHALSGIRTCSHIPIFIIFSMEPFIPNRSLLDPKFEGYQLDPTVNQEDTVIRYNLEYKPSQIATPGTAPLKFQEVQSRITHNHIAVAPQGGCAVYIDAEYRVISIDVDLVSNIIVPSMRWLFSFMPSSQSR